MSRMMQNNPKTCFQTYESLLTSTIFRTNFTENKIKEIMKARNFKTGEVFAITDKSGLLLEEGVFKLLDFDIQHDEPETLTTSFDWDAFRNETASKAMQALISNPNIKRPMSFNDAAENIAFSNVAIQYADELIKQLQTTSK